MVAELVTLHTTFGLSASLQSQRERGIEKRINNDSTQFSIGTTSGASV